MQKVNLTNAREWCERELSEYDTMCHNYFLLHQETEFPTETSKSLHKAKITRAERMLKKQEIKANAATYIQQILLSCNSGIISMEIPEADIQIKIQW